MRQLRLLFRVWLFLITVTSVTFAQRDTLRIVTYNLLKFPRSYGAQRVDDFRRVVQAIEPDILVVQELETRQGLETLLNDVLNVDDKDYYDAAPFKDGPDTDSGLLYNRDKVSLLGVSSLYAWPRLIMEYRLEASGVKFYIYSVHLKAGSSPGDSTERWNEASVLRAHLNKLPSGTRFLVVGDFNMRGSKEPAFLKLNADEADNDGRLFDPLNLTGNWHNNPLVAKIHTQSTRTRELPDGGSWGGLDDRFDMILVSQAILDKNAMWMVPGSYRAFGNDGRHYNLAINDNRNFAVPDSIADALHDASDHLPVAADVVVDATTGVLDTHPDVPRAFTLSQNYPNPFNADTRISYSLSRAMQVTIDLLDLQGRRVKRLLDARQPAGEHTLLIEARDLPTGVYIVAARVGNWTQQRKILLLK